MTAPCRPAQDSKNTKKGSISASLKGNRQRPILPGRVQPSTFGTGELNCCVRYGNRWDLSVITTGRFSGWVPVFPSGPLPSFRLSASLPVFPYPQPAVTCFSSLSLRSSGCFQLCTSQCTLTTAQVRFNTSDLTIDLIVSLNDFSFGFVISSA